MKTVKPLVGVLAIVLGLLNMAAAQDASDKRSAMAGATSSELSRPETAAMPVSRTAPAAAHSDIGAIKPGDRNCLQSTGSLIPAKPGHCLSVPGRSYGQQELRDTGQIDAARALQQLDPSISVGR